MLKKTFGFLLVIAVIAVLWACFALWTGMYSVYSLPPSRQEPDGFTALVHREEGEPAFNSPDYVAPAPKKRAGGGIGFESVPKPKRPIAERTIVRLPFIDWAYKKSLEKPDNTR